MGFESPIFQTYYALMVWVDWEGSYNIATLSEYDSAKLLLAVYHYSELILQQ